MRRLLPACGVVFLVVAALVAATVDPFDFAAPSHRTTQTVLIGSAAITASPASPRRFFAHNAPYRRAFAAPGALQFGDSAPAAFATPAAAPTTGLAMAYHLFGNRRCVEDEQKAREVWLGEGAARRFWGVAIGVRQMCLDLGLRRIEVEMPYIAPHAAVDAAPHPPSRAAIQWALQHATDVLRTALHSNVGSTASPQSAVRMYPHNSPFLATVETSDRDPTSSVFEHNNRGSFPGFTQPQTTIEVYGRYDTRRSMLRPASPSLETQALRTVVAGLTGDDPAVSAASPLSTGDWTAHYPSGDACPAVDADAATGADGGSRHWSTRLQLHCAWSLGARSPGEGDPSRGHAVSKTGDRGTSWRVTVNAPACAVSVQIWTPAVC